MKGVKKKDRRKKDGKKKDRGRTKKTYGALNNLWYWLKALYRESPFFVLLYGAGIAVGIASSLLGVYMPSVLVADITAGEGIWTVILNLAVLGGGVVFLHLADNWMEQTKWILSQKPRWNQDVRLAEESMEADYVNVERADFPGEYWELRNRHAWRQDYTTTFMEELSTLTKAVIGMILYVGMLSGLSVWILLLIIAGTAISCEVGVLCNRWDAKNCHKWHDLDNKMFYLSRSTSTYEASKDVHLYHMPPWLRKLYEGELSQRLRYTVRQQGNFYLQGAVHGFTRMIWEGAAYLYLIYLVCTGELDAAGFVFYFGMITGFASWCEAIAYGMIKMHKYSTYVEEERRFFERLRGGRKEQDQEKEFVLEEGHIPEIIFENVSFRYEGEQEPILKHLNLTLKPGENLALVGLNGAGKSTFVKLLCGFYDPTKGRILVDGVDRAEYSRRSFLRCFSGVFQDAELLPLSLRENLTMGEDVGEERLAEVLKMADLEEKVKKLPGGLETMFGMGSNEEAVDFSGGELQKLLLARAISRKAPFLVLDEPTAALDPLMENALYEQYRRFSADRTTVFISHRLASTRFCDRILLLENGQVSESGSHEELMEKNGRYAWMFQLQSKYYQKLEQQKEAGLEGEAVQEA